MFICAKLDYQTVFVMYSASDLNIIPKIRKSQEILSFSHTYSIEEMKEYLSVRGTKKRKIREGHERSPLLFATPFVEHFLQVPSLASIKSLM